MNIFLVVMAKGQAPLDDGLADELLAAGETRVPLEGPRTTHWRSGDGRTVLVSWQNPWSYFEIHDHVFTEPDGFTTFNGYVLPTGEDLRPGRSVAERLHGHLKRCGRFERSEFAGEYSVAHYRSGELRVAGDSSGVQQVFWSESGEHIVVSNRVSLVTMATERLSGTTASYDWVGLAGLALLNYAPMSLTPYRKVQALQADAELVAEASGRLEIVVPAQIPVYDEGWSEMWRRNPGEMWRQAGHALSDHLYRLIAGNIHPLVLRLTADADSRVIAAGLYSLRDRVDLRRVTALTLYESASDEELEPSRIVADMLGVSYETGKRSQEDWDWDAFLEHAAVHLFVTEGGMSLQDTLSSHEPKPEVVLTGVGGEILKAPYGLRAKISTQEELRKHIRTHLFPNHVHRLMRQEVVDALMAGTEDWFQAMLDRGARYEDLLDLFYLYNQQGRWGGCSKHASGLLWMMVWPLNLLPLYRAAFAAGPAARRANAVHFNLMARLAPGIEALPLAEKSSWREEVREFLAGWMAAPAVAPPRHTAGATPTLGWLHRWSGVWRDGVRELLLSDSGSPFFDLVSRADLERLLDAPPEGDMFVTRRIFDLMTVRMLVDRGLEHRSISPWKDAEKRSASLLLERPAETQASPTPLAGEPERGLWGSLRALLGAGPAETAASLARFPGAELFDPKGAWEDDGLRREEQALFFSHGARVMGEVVAGLREHGLLDPSDGKLQALLLEPGVFQFWGGMCEHFGSVRAVSLRREEYEAARAVLSADVLKQADFRLAPASGPMPGAPEAHFDVLVLSFREGSAVSGPAAERMVRALKPGGTWVVFSDCRGEDGAAEAADALAGEGGACERFATPTGVCVFAGRRARED